MCAQVRALKYEAAADTDDPEESLAGIMHRAKCMPQARLQKPNILDRESAATSQAKRQCLESRVPQVLMNEPLTAMASVEPVLAKGADELEAQHTEQETKQKQTSVSVELPRLNLAALHRGRITGKGPQFATRTAKLDEYAASGADEVAWQLPAGEEL